MPSILPLIVLAQVAAATAPAAALAPAFAIRADPSVAEKVDHVLKRIGRPQLSTVPSGTDPAIYIANACGNFSSPQVLSTAPSSYPETSWVWHEPCLRFRQNREFEVREGSRLADFAVSSGLKPSSLATAEVQKRGANNWLRASPRTLSIGDRIRFPKVPLWTVVKTDAAVIATRKDLVRRIAAELGCKNANPEVCLRQKAVDVVDANPGEAAGEARMHLLGERQVMAAPPAVHSSTVRSTVEALSQSMVASSAIIGPPAAATTTATATAAAPPTIAPPTGAASASTPGALPVSGPAAPSATALSEAVRDSAPVAADQWPYDRKLLAATLSADAPLRPVVIGVADAGLARASGDPLPTVAFYRNPGEDPVPNGIDDDGNGYVDDIYGAGILRHDEPANGDLGLCQHSPATFDTLEAARRALADHGPIVASIAAALAERTQAPLVGLPKIVFFRLVDDLCSPGANANMSEAAFVKALEYVFEPAHIFVLSYTYGADSQGDFKRAAKEELQRSDVLLVMPAGNDGPGDIDDNPPCPACLAAGNERDDLNAQRTLLVGAADEDLTILPSSNWAVHLVRLYAPADTSGTIDIAGHDASGRTPATSWAAPYVGLAAGIIQSYGIDRARDIRERLLAASWPVRDSGGKTDALNSGVVNVTAAAAVRHAAIDVVEKGADGHYARRTYVGTLDTPRNDLCPEGTLGKRLHALRFGKDIGGEREILWRSMTYDPQNQTFLRGKALCTLPAQIRFTDLIKGPLQFESEAVTQILLPWL